MTMNNDMLMTHCCNCGHLVSKSASGTKSIMVCAKCGAEIEVTVAGKGTVDEKVLKALQDKANLAKALVDDYRAGRNPFGG